MLRCELRVLFRIADSESARQNGCVAHRTADLLHVVAYLREFAPPRFCVLELSHSNVPALRFGESAPRSDGIC